MQNGNTFTLNVGNVAAGASADVAFAVIIDSPLPAGVTQTENTTSITDGNTRGPDQNPSDNNGTDTTPIDAAPDYQIDKVENFTDPANPGDTIEWSISVTNAGNQDGTGVVVTDTLPNQALFGTFVAGQGGVVDTAAGTVTWNVGPLAVGDSVTFTLSTTVSTDLTAGFGPQENRVIVTDDRTNGPDLTPLNNRDTETLTIEFVDLRIDKDDGGAVPGPTDTLIYTLTYANDGNATAEGVVITETLPPNTTFDPANSTTGWVQNGDTLSYAVGSLTAGEQGSITFAVTIDYPISPTVLSTENTVLITDNGNKGPDPTPENNRDTEKTVIDNPGPNVDNITLSQLRPDYIYPPREWTWQEPELHGRLISSETETITANLQGGRNGGNFDPAFGPVDGRFYPNDWSRIFRHDLSIEISPATGTDKSSPLALDRSVGHYRADSLFGEFENPAASPALPGAEVEQSPVAPPQLHPTPTEPLNLGPERSQLQLQLDEIARELSEAQVSPLLAALAAISAEEAHQASDIRP
ncbi:DUF11 domain-containing protein [Microbulbifer sp. Q7]|uniref:DUF11 domain-containing protein n=1 Tax=Microbulbifer sp. Q7 TaxID=1785091 RepID=UPI000837345B|nr:DUF11 domain-containing protein [Microbulbifer sp. Q7]